MKVLLNDHIHMRQPNSDHICDLYVMHVLIDDVDERAQEIISGITDTSWLNEMNVVNKATFEACSRRTIVKLVNEVVSNTIGQVNPGFGEIMISDTARCILMDYHDHQLAPLAELIKERVSGNGGFDFHTESPRNNIIYGEAKFSGITTRYTEALSQINEFISDNKDIAELAVLDNFVSELARIRSVQGSKGFTAAFSLVCNNPALVLNNATRSEHLISLFEYEEIYLIGVEVNA